MRVVIDSGGLDALKDDRTRRTVVDYLRDNADLELLVPAVVVTEFLRQFSSSSSSAIGYIALKVASEFVSVTRVRGENAARLAHALGAAGKEVHTCDFIVGAIASEAENGYLITGDKRDFEAIRAVGGEFEIITLAEVMGSG